MTAGGLAEIGLVLSVFDPTKLDVQNISYYTPFVSGNVDNILNVVQDLHDPSAGFLRPWD